jgi:hypothetical protein
MTQGEIFMKSLPLTQEQADELNAIFGLNRQGKKRKRILVWESAVGRCELGDYQIIPLTSSWALRLEGQKMNHCIGHYDRLCAQGLFRAFSIRNLVDQRIATMSLVFQDHTWQLDQVSGLDNAEVCLSEEVIYDGEQTETLLDMTEIHSVACEVVRLYRRAWEASAMEAAV